MRRLIGCCAEDARSGAEWGSGAERSGEERGGVGRRRVLPRCEAERSGEEGGLIVVVTVARSDGVACRHTSPLGSGLHRGRRDVKCIRRKVGSHGGDGTSWRTFG